MGSNGMGRGGRTELGDRRSQLESTFSPRMQDIEIEGLDLENQEARYDRMHILPHSS
jgi:hypothetical protein